MWFRTTVTVSSSGGRPAFHDVTEQTRAAVTASGIRNGLVCVYSHHTTCCVITQEEAFDLAAGGLETLQQDFVDVLEDLVPTQRGPGLYQHPGPQALAFAARHGEDHDAAHNTDAHLRSALIGRSETIPVVDGGLDLGQFGRVYFIDFDTTRARDRTVSITVLGD